MVLRKDTIWNAITMLEAHEWQYRESQDKTDYPMYKRTLEQLHKEFDRLNKRERR